MEINARARFTLVRIAVASFIVLFQELALIRWLPEQLRALAYFPNVILISAFLGLGVGCLLARRRSLLSLWPVFVALIAGSAAYLSRFAFTQESATDHLWLLYYDLPANATVIPSIRLPIMLMFVLSALTFVPLGQYVAARLVIARDTSSSLWGYASDLAGSLAGVIAFSILSYAGTRPVIWFAIALGAALLLYESRALLVWHAVLSVVVLIVVVRSQRATDYSPYYALRVQPRPPGFNVLTNGSLHQYAAPLRRADPLPAGSPVDLMRSGYHLPYGILAARPRRVLVLGAGTGNDVAVALDEGAEQVDAVEIDPVILRIGRDHPDHPYSNPRVRLFNTDARAFLNHTSERYDLVVFGTLDSMTRLSALSSVRLDNYVYTADCLRAVRRHLQPGGGVAMYFWVGKRYIDQHIRALIAVGLQESPAVIQHEFVMFNSLYLAGPGFRRAVRNGPLTPGQVAEIDAGIAVPTDDWPYLYLADRGVTPFYLSIIAMIVGLAVLSVFGVSPQMRRSLGGRQIDLVMFLFGVAFTLIETRLVTEMNLVWGATWLTSAVVFGSILATIIIATLLMQVRPLRWSSAAGGLMTAMLLTWLVPAHTMVGLDPVPRLLASALFAGLPVFFASCCFALLFRERAEPDVAFGWNMLGAVLGGLLEFTSMALGIKAMALLAGVAYLLALLVRERSLRPAPLVASGAPQPD
ncbi:MAG: hypothetical protein JWN02_2195 [Acidobacteria bacterium]|nr:hypothetical protein [Acidobacteriota bacterium]